MNIWLLLILVLPWFNYFKILILFSTIYGVIKFYAKLNSQMGLLNSQINLDKSIRCKIIYTTKFPNRPSKTLNQMEDD